MCALGRAEVPQASMRACRFVPEPEMRTVMLKEAAVEYLRVWSEGTAVRMVDVEEKREWEWAVAWELPVRVVEEVVEVLRAVLTVGGLITFK
jgi:hypothetical protein